MGEDIEFVERLAKALELRQMWMQIESADFLKQAEAVKRGIDFDRRWRAIRFGCRSKPEEIFHRYTKSSEKRPREASEPLPWRDRLVSMVLEFDDVTLQLLAFRKMRDIADVVVRTNKGEMIRMVEERAERFDLVALRSLGCSLGIEADDYQRVDSSEKTCVEWRDFSVVRDALDFRDALTC